MGRPVVDAQPVSRATEWLWVVLAFLLLNLFYASSQPVNRFNDGLGRGYDGQTYHAMAKDMPRVLPPVGVAPFVFRLGTPLLAAGLAKSQDWVISAGFDRLGLACNALSLVFLTLLLQRHVGSAFARMVVVIAFLVEPHSPVRFSQFNPVSVDAATLTFLLAGLLGVEWYQARPSSFRATLLAALVAAGVAFHEVMLIIGVCALLGSFPTLGFGSWRERLDTIDRTKAWLPLVCGVLMWLAIHDWVVATPSDYSLATEAMRGLSETSPLQYGVAWFLVFGPLLALPVYFWRHSLRLLAEQPVWLVYLATLAVAAWLVGTETEKLLVFASPIVYVMVAQAITWARLGPTTVAMASLLFAQAISSRVFAAIGGPILPPDVRTEIWERLWSAESAWLLSYDNMWSQFATPSLMTFYVLWYGLVSGSVLAFLWYQDGGHTTVAALAERASPAVSWLALTRDAAKALLTRSGTAAASAPAGHTLFKYLRGRRARFLQWHRARRERLALPSRRYLRLVTRFLAGGFGSIILLSWVADPYEFQALFGFRERRSRYLVDAPESGALGFYPNPMATRLAKAHNVRLYQPDAAAFGSSTVYDSIRPLHSGWTSRGWRAYNFGVPSGSLFEAMTLFEHAEALHPLKQAIVGLDLVMFNIHKPGYLDDVPLAQQSDYQNRFARYFLSETTSLDYWKKSLNQLGVPTAMPTTEEFLKTALERLVPPSVAAAGTPDEQDVLFRQRLLEFEQQVMLSLVRQAVPGFAFADATGHSTFDHLRTIIRISRADGVDLRLFISASHARLWVMLRFLELGPLVEHWKRQLVEILAEDEDRHPGLPAIPLWDFGGFNEITTEALPSASNGSVAFKNHLDSLHYSQDVGDLILDRVLDYTPADRHAPEGFGVRLRRDNIEAHLALMRLAEEQYISEHRDELQGLSDLVRKLMAESKASK